MPETVSTIRYSPGPGTLRARLSGATKGLGQPHPLLVRAGDDVFTSWQMLLAQSFETRETRETVGWLVAAIDGATREEEVPVPDGSVSLARFLLEQVSGSLLQQLSADEAIEKSDVIQLMQGIERVRQSIAPDWDRYFSSQISGPDGLNLVLEVAHDLRSPLTSIRCLAESMERGQSGPVTDLQRKQLRLIYSASLGLGSMATDVIEMARRGDQLVEGVAVPFSISELLEGVSDMVRPMAEEKGLTFQFQKLSTDQRVGRPFALSRVLLNLVTNAFKFTDAGGVDVQIRPTGMTRIEFSVIDTGGGIPESAIPDLFRPFRRSMARADRTGFLFSGTGLGLALCRKLLRAMNSDLYFETRLGHGTRFFFEVDLPATPRL